MFFIFINKNTNRLLIVRKLSIAILLILCLRLFFLQIKPTEEVVTQYQNQQSEVVSDYSYLVLDTNGKNIKNYNKEFIVVIDKKPFSLNNYTNSFESLLTLNYIMKEEYKDFNFTDIMSSEGKTYYKVSEDTYDKINKITKLKGVYAYIRDNSVGSDAWNIGNYIGSIKKDKNYSKDSLQYTLQQYIKDNNIPKKDFYLNNESCFISSGINNIEDNKNIKLTIDKEMEDKIRSVLTKENYSGLKNLGVILMESGTGKIKAMVQSDESEANVNLCVKGIGYEPGSIFKIITLSTALEEGKVTMDDMYYCNGKVCNSKNIHGWISLQDALNKSCNDTFASVGNKVGYDTLMNYCDKLGLFQKVIGLEEETRGLKPDEAAGLNNISIGQCLTVSPVQILGAVNTLVNDGVYVKPYLVEAIDSIDNNNIKSFENEGKKVFSQTTAKIVQKSMVSVVEKGTGIKAKVNGIEIGGKTGSATSGTGDSTHAWFIGYFTYNNVKYTMVVFVPNISKIGENGEELGGGNTAAPIFSDIIENIIKNGQ